MMWVVLIAGVILVIIGELLFVNECERLKKSKKKILSGIALFLIGDLLAVWGIISLVPKKNTPISVDYYPAVQYDLEALSQEVKPEIIEIQNQRDPEYIVCYVYKDHEEWKYYKKSEEAKKYDKYRIEYKS